MRLGDAITNAGRAFRDRPADLLPLYVLETAIAALVQVATLLTLAALGWYLHTTGRVPAIRRRLDEVGHPPNPETAPEAFVEWVTGVVVAIEPSITLQAWTAIGATAVLTASAVVLATAAINAAQLAGSLGRLRGDRGLAAGLAGMRRFWLSFLGLYVIELLSWIAITGGAVLLVDVATSQVALGTLGSVIGSVGVLVATVGWVVAGILLRVTFAFAPVGVVVDDVGAVRGTRYAASYVRRRPAEAGFYSLLAIAAFVGFVLFASALGTVGVAAGSGLVLSLLVVPLLDLVKTTLYAGGRGAISPQEPVDRSLGGQLRAGLARGWRELATFVRATPGLHTLAAGTLIGGILCGWVLAAPLDGVVESSISVRLSNHVPPVAAVELFGNNVSVSLTIAFSGLFAAIPSLVQLAFNGVVIGALARTEVAPLELVAFITPHGIFELPAIAVSGAVGLSLGITGFHTVWGSGTRTALADELERAFWVLVGVAVVLAFAALIEGFVSPYYWRPFL